MPFEPRPQQPSRFEKVYVVDSHTGGEPTRVVYQGGPDLGPGNLAERRKALAERHNDFRRAVTNEPRGSDVWVTALLTPPLEAGSTAGVVFMNNVGPLGMCVHGTIGLAVTLGFLGHAALGRHRLETPVGTVEFDLHDQHRVSVTNVPSYRFRKQVTLDVPDVGPVVGDVAWGGNWFFLCDSPLPLDRTNIPRLTDAASRIRRSLQAHQIVGRDGGEVDHVELFGPPSGSSPADSRNFVLCPGLAYDRSPCGTGTSAKLACLFADGKLAPGQTWRQESIVGSVFEGSVQPLDDHALVSPTITGSAHITAESVLLFDPDDPFRLGLP